MRKKNMTRHHKIHRSDGWSNHHDNIEIVTWVVHEAIHTLFSEQNSLPIDKINRLLQIDYSVYEPEVVEMIYKTINEVKELWIEAYNPKCFNDKNVFTKK